MSYRLLISVVPHNCGEEIVTVANNTGAGGGTIVMGRGTASNSIIQLLGLGDTQKDVVFIIVESAVEKAVRSAIMEAVSDRKGHFGFMVSCKLNGFIKAGDLDKNFEEEKGAEKMADGYEMINVIVNKGYAEDAMAAARKAGAGGGTIINARGTAKEGDAKFFGMEIVPEKEMLMILVPAEKKDAIIAAIKELPCLSKAGSGIVFCNEAENFTLLGK